MIAAQPGVIPAIATALEPALLIFPVSAIAEHVSNVTEAGYVLM